MAIATGVIDELQRMCPKKTFGEAEHRQPWPGELEKHPPPASGMFSQSATCMNVREKLTNFPILSESRCILLISLDSRSEARSFSEHWPVRQCTKGSVVPIHPQNVHT